jgi:hypothetical protein
MRWSIYHQDTAVYGRHNIFTLLSMRWSIYHDIFHTTPKSYLKYYFPHSTNQTSSTGSTEPAGIGRTKTVENKTQKKSQ